jgi:hypothetical protein
MHEPANAVLFLQYFYMLFLGLHGLVEVLVSMRCSLPWLANMMLYSAFLSLDVSVNVHRFTKNIHTTSEILGARRVTCGESHTEGSQIADDLTPGICAPVV